MLTIGSILQNDGGSSFVQVLHSFVLDIFTNPATLTGQTNNVNTRYHKLRKDEGNETQMEGGWKALHKVWPHGSMFAYMCEVVHHCLALCGKGQDKTSCV